MVVIKFIIIVGGRGAIKNTEEYSVLISMMEIRRENEASTV